MFNPWVGKMPWRRERQPTPVFLPGEFHGQKKGKISCSHPPGMSVKETHSWDDTGKILPTAPQLTSLPCSVASNHICFVIAVLCGHCRKFREVRIKIVDGNGWTPSVYNS